MDEKQMMRDLLFKGKIERVIEIQEIPFKLRSLLANEQLEVEKEISGMRSSLNVVSHTYYMLVLSKALISAGDKVFETPDACKEWLESQSTILVYRLMDLQRALEKDIAELVGGLTKEKMENFTKTPESEKD